LGIVHMKGREMNKLDKLLVNPAKFLIWWEAPENRQFNEFLQEYRTSVIHGLSHEKIDVELHRLQGELKAIDTLMTLKETVREYSKGLQAGTMKKIGEENAKHV
jgi:hypothetical protein